MTVVVMELSPSALAVLRQLFCAGPVWDGFVASKDGRSVLVKAGLAQRGSGWTWLTEDGVMAALEFGKASTDANYRGKATCR